MFGPMHALKYVGAMRRAKSLPSRNVSWKEYLRCAKAAGMEKPEFYGRLMHGLGAVEIVVGNERLQIAGRIPKKEPTEGSGK